MRALVETLARIDDAMAGAREPWWIIGSAAVVLHAVETTVADVDLLCGEADARDVLTVLGGEPAEDSGTELFRSAVFGRIESTPLPVEVMAGFAVLGVPVLLQTREWLELGAVQAPVPSRTELIALLRRFGRPKDLARAALLER